MHTLKVYGVADIWLNLDLTLALDGSYRSTLCPGCFAYGEGALGPIAEETGWAPEPAWALWRRE